MRHVIVFNADIGNLACLHNAIIGTRLIFIRRYTRLQLHKRIAKLAAALCLSLLALPVSAMTGDEYFEDGNRLYRDDLYWAALLRYRQAIAAGYETPLLYYNAGVAHYRAKQHIRARESLLKAVDQPSLRIVTQYNLGLNAYAGGNEEEALQWLRLARDQQENRTISEYARVAIARIRARQALDDPILIQEEEQREAEDALRLSFHAQVAFGSDSNVFRTQELVYVDESDPLLPVITPNVQSGAYMPVNVGVRYRIRPYDFEDFYASYRLVGRYYQDKELENGNEFTHEVAFGSNYDREDEENERHRRVISAFRIAQHDESYYDRDTGDARVFDDELLGDRFDYLRYGPELEVQQHWRRLGVGLHVKGQLWNYEETENVPEYDHEYFAFGGFAQFKFTSTSLLRLDLKKAGRQFGDRRARNLDASININNPNLRYDYLSAKISARQKITRNMWFGVHYERQEREDRHVGYNDYGRDTYGGEFHWNIGKRLELDIGGHYRLYDFTNAFAFNNPTSALKTLETVNIDGKLRFRVTPRLSVVLQAEFDDRISSDRRIGYERVQYVLGVRWQQ